MLNLQIASLCRYHRIPFLLALVPDHNPKVSMRDTEGVSRTSLLTETEEISWAPLDTTREWYERRPITEVRGESPAVHGGDESDNPSTNSVRRAERIFN